MKFVHVALIASTASLSTALDSTRGGGKRRRELEQLEDLGGDMSMSMMLLDDPPVTTDYGGLSKSSKTKPPPEDGNICTGATSVALPFVPRTGGVTCSAATMINKPDPKDENTWTKFPQTGGNVSCGSQGKMDVGNLVPNTVAPFTKDRDACVTNVHVHLGAEHRSDGEYGPEFGANGPYQAGGTYNTYRAKYYDPADEHFTRQYIWKHCSNVRVGETYEFHWPQATSTFAACDNPWQYQSTFTDGLLCNYSPAAGGLEAGGFSPQDLADNIGVEAQVFTIVNNFDNTYDMHDHENLLEGPVVDSYLGAGELWAYYTGSRTGGSFGYTVEDDNCDDVSPVTWKVDQKAHLLTAEAMDRFCLDQQAWPGMKKCGSDDCEEIPGYAIDADGCCYPSAHVDEDNTRKVVVDDLSANNRIFTYCD